MPPKRKLPAILWSIAVFIFALLADMCFQHWDLYVFGIASVVAAIVSVVFAIALMADLHGL